MIKKLQRKPEVIFIYIILTISQSNGRSTLYTHSTEALKNGEGIGIYLIVFMLYYVYNIYILVVLGRIRSF